MKKIVNNSFLMAYPVLILIILMYNNSLREQFMRNFVINPIHLIVLSLVYFSLFAYLIFSFLMRKEEFNLICLVIGLIEIILISLPKFVFILSFNLANAIYSNAILTYWNFGIIFIIYLLMLTSKICKNLD